MNALLPLPVKRPQECPQLTAREYPQVIKYMGSKARIIDFVVEGLNEGRNDGLVCDLFAGACSLSGAIGHLVPIATNDIQNYSRAIAHCYLHKLSDAAQNITPEDIVKRAEGVVRGRVGLVSVSMRHDVEPTLETFNHIEHESRSLINESFSDPYHLFLKNYSGTWWSAEQCAWIDALRQVIDEMLANKEINTGDHAIFLTSVMHAMAYCGQGTGHYAQYRDAKTISSMHDIHIYRRKSIASYFSRKLSVLTAWNGANVKPNEDHQYLSLDYRNCLSQLPTCTVYADPPYAFVHYSRFYHAIETFTLYDYPSLQIKGSELVKGRYREDRHQSPFSIRSKVENAFKEMFTGVSDHDSNLILSYSNTALLDLEEMIELAHSTFGGRYEIEVMTMDHQHMTMGRRADRLREVEEALLIVKRQS